MPNEIDVLQLAFVLCVIEFAQKVFMPTRIGITLGDTLQSKLNRLFDI